MWNSRRFPSPSKMSYMGGWGEGVSVCLQFSDIKNIIGLPIKYQVNLKIETNWTKLKEIKTQQRNYSRYNIMIYDR